MKGQLKEELFAGVKVERLQAKLENLVEGGSGGEDDVPGSYLTEDRTVEAADGAVAEQPLEGDDQADDDAKTIEVYCPVLRPANCLISRCYHLY